MTNRATVTENDIHAYVDGFLDDEGRSKVEQWLKSRPEEAKRVQSYIDQNAQMHDLFYPVLDEPAPIKLTNEIQLSGRYRHSVQWRNIAAGILLLAAGGASGWWLHDLFPETASARIPVAMNAISAHAVYVSEIRHPVEVGADQEKHLVGWLSKRLGKPVRAPALTASGYRLVGGRLLPDNGQPAAQFMYENEAGNRVTIYVRRSIEGLETAFKFVSQTDASAFYWVDNDFAYALTSKLDRDKLLELARLVYQELDQN